MKKISIVILTVLAIIMIILPLTINAAQINPDDYGKNITPNATDVKDMYKFGGSVAGVIQIVGTAVSAGAMIIIGIRYLVASADEKAEYRERMIPYFIGAVLLFGASNVVKILYKIFS